MTVATEETLSADQQAAFDLIIRSVNQAEYVGGTGREISELPPELKGKKFFLGGEPGCGKSYLVRRLIKEVGRSKCAVMSPTAIAAQLIGGTTVHSFFGFNYNRLFDKGGRPQFSADKLNSILDDSRLIICDEVSMLSAGYFQLVMYLTQQYNVTTVFVGDFMQLPPIPDYKYGKPFQQKAYECDWWQDLQPLILKKNFRQTDDDELLMALSHMRVGQYTMPVYNLIKDRLQNYQPPFATKIYAHRKTVEEENHRRLKELNEEIHEFHARVVETVVPGHAADRMLNGARIPRKISLAKGARIVMLTNDKDRRWCNGSTGEVTEIDKNQMVKIQLDDGRVITTSTCLHDICDANGATVVKFSQLPLMLAFAMTVHRIQGQTMDYVSVDLSNHFETGMTYVAVSRCRSREGLFLSGRFDPAKNLMVDQRAVELFNSLPAASELNLEPDPKPEPAAAPAEPAVELRSNGEPWGPTFQLGPEDEEF